MEPGEPWSTSLQHQSPSTALPSTSPVDVMWGCLGPCSTPSGGSFTCHNSNLEASCKPYLGVPARPPLLPTLPVPAGLLQHLQLNPVYWSQQPLQLPPEDQQQQQQHPSWQGLPDLGQQQMHLDSQLLALLHSSSSTPQQQQQLNNPQQPQPTTAATRSSNPQQQQKKELQLLQQQQHSCWPLEHHNPYGAVPASDKPSTRRCQDQSKQQASCRAEPAHTPGAAAAAQAGQHGVGGPRQLKTYTGKKPVLSVVVKDGITIYERVSGGSCWLQARHRFITSCAIAKVPYERVSGGLVGSRHVIASLHLAP
jgi:hypothetical protein